VMFPLYCKSEQNNCSCPDGEFLVECTNGSEGCVTEDDPICESDDCDWSNQSIISIILTFTSIPSYLLFEKMCLLLFDIVNISLMISIFTISKPEGDWLYLLTFTLIMMILIFMYRSIRIIIMQCKFC
jgi:hypothetical protein